MYLCLKCDSVYENNFNPREVYYDDKIWRWCPISDCIGDLIELDDNMVEIIRILNNKGYNTLKCCGGHANEKKPHIYIMFDMDEIDIRDLNLPEGFKPDYNMNSIRYGADGNDVLTNQILLNRYHSVLCEWVYGLE